MGNYLVTIAWCNYCMVKLLYGETNACMNSAKMV